MPKKNELPLWMGKSPKEYRLKQMRTHSKYYGKSSPSRDDLLLLIPKDMKCPSCEVKMIWTAPKKVGLRRVISLQHDRSGKIRLICFSCNSRHSHLKCSESVFYSMGRDKKYCNGCQRVKSINDFWADNSNSSTVKRKGRCKICAYKSHRRWILRNDKLKQKQKEGTT